MLTVKQILEAVNRVAPWDLAESWDQVGLQVGRTQQPARRILVALDLRPEVIEEGISLQVDGFITHHPLIFKPLARLDLDTPLGASLERLLKANLFFIAVHTNADKAEDGLNQYLAERLGLESLVPLVGAGSDSTCKVTVFVPAEHARAIRRAMAEAGAGRMGDYQECAFQVQGSGSFRPGASAHPWIGQPEQQTDVPEIRLEMVAARADLPRILAAIRSHHPYEEPAIDVVPLVTQPKAGLGRIGRLPEPLTLGDFSRKVQEQLQPTGMRICGDPERKIRRVALCTGSGGSLLKMALQSRADLYLSGDLGYHDFLTAQEHGLALLDAGHWATERIFGDWLLGHFSKLWSEADGPQLLLSRAIREEPYHTL
ncbi:dinuclear metal center YbgI/SA1388 family protein [Hydrogenispora ethanolica]|jgi:dinuclear metal center YbgI/SA1388 family protein|uniref:GTP cyclohydrolase 1 type 2 homolog n=1 Tax=Hydrogenispora ethanolica TaxID=1082276 RepID=A0A4R1R7Q3_HYDET|nr:Nif3-like dinuclear metal center hexameric protein [Hydrogenispora ethanolica]TCL61539.1 dinuclear metal center YbgI/SA1388 family protein [Hydrogenispora ethanolica]